jgi:hypothetical protein
MTNVEQIRPGFQWAEPLQGKNLTLEVVGSDLLVAGLFPTYSAEDSPCDLLRQYEKSPKQIAIGQQRTGTHSPEVSFANAHTDEELIAFVRRFGPVVAKSVEDTAMIPDKELGEPRWPRRLIAHQDMEELRKEQMTYRAALALVVQLDQVNQRHVSVQQLMLAIDAKLTEELKQTKMQYHYALVQQMMKIFAETFAQSDRSSHNDLSVRHLLQGIAESIDEKVDKSNHASALRLAKIFASGVQNYLDHPVYDYSSAQKLMSTIATNIQGWPSQWEREKSLRGDEPRWKLSSDLLKLIEAPNEPRSDLFIPDFVAARRVICGLLNSFPSTVFPNPIEMHSSIRFGIRPLLYSILRRQFINPRGFAFCANTECRNFFNVERAGQQFCSSECSLRHRQRIYWQDQGKKLREKRVARAKKVREKASKPATKRIAWKKTE